VDGIPAGKLYEYLWTKHRIWTSPTVMPGEYEGVRVTPNVYTTIEEIDAFAEAMEQIAKMGTLPG
jgi:selenocysteine lyase/cysteine desulfurase